MDFTVFYGDHNNCYFKLLCYYTYAMQDVSYKYTGSIQYHTIWRYKMHNAHLLAEQNRTLTSKELEVKTSDAWEMGDNDD